MLKYILKRIGYMLAVLLILSIIMFVIYNLVPSDRAYTDAKAEIIRYKNLPQEERDNKFEELYHEYQVLYGTDVDNKIVRYLRWVGLAPYSNGKLNGLLQGNFGYSYQYNKDVVDIIKDPMRNTMFINVFATLLALGITIPLGISCAVKRGKFGDKTMQVVTIIGYSLPTFLIAIVFIWFFCSLFKILPPSGMTTPGRPYADNYWRDLLDRMYYLILPLIVMTFCSLGGMTRYVRASMIEALSMDCIKTARAKGLREKVVVYSHAWRNALIPVVTLVVGWFLGIFSGSIVIEQMFAINGMGNLLYTSLRTQDYDVVMLMQMFYVLMSLLGNLIIDIIYGLVDPRVRVNK